MTRIILGIGVLLATANVVVSVRRDDSLVAAIDGLILGLVFATWLVALRRRT